jgi:hypothetical protein
MEPPPPFRTAIEKGAYTMRKKIFLLAITIAFSVTLGFSPAYGGTGIVVSEVMSHPENAAAGSDDEYVEVLNIGTEDIDLASCWIASANGNKQRLIPYTGAHRHGRQGTVLPPMGIALITTSRYSGAYGAFIKKNGISDLIHVTIDGSRFLSYGLNNNAGIVLLLDEGGRTLDAFSWSSDAGKGVSWERENPNIKSSALVRRFGGTPGLAARHNTLESAKTRARLEQRVVRSGEEGRLILSLQPGERARVSLKSRDGREIAVIQERVEGAGRHEIPIILRTKGEKLMSGSYLVHLRFTKSTGERTHETILIQIAPRLR